MIGLAAGYQRNKTSQEKLAEITAQLTAHVGKYAILKEHEGRNTSVYFLHLLSPYKGEYRCYDSNGNVRCTITKLLSPKEIMINTQHLVLLDN